MFRWLLTNGLTILVIMSVSIYRGYDSNAVLFGKLLGQGAFILFLVNLNMYFVFLLIRKSRIRDVKVSLAKTSKKMMKYHVPFAVTATLLILTHAMFMGYAHFGSLFQAKTASGAVAILVLSVLLYSGYRRRQKATGKRRKFHYTMAFIFIAFALGHIFL
ncbi:hypothetical protein D1B31_15055 [Neobacillus notoginsengisoli]|uniref:Ferric oxidoreductase domain-containing protein n=1 Tax=Neobacillus notoginsengisoli TaxID=1578198 RepID=A0A417YSB6_9BACI|nr:hypothetical protein D1B31_15055 [Neobacillus notoginsengisoli]